MFTVAAAKVSTFYIPPVSRQWKGREPEWANPQLSAGNCPIVTKMH